MYVWSVEDQFCKIHHSTSCYTKGLACDRRRLLPISNQIYRIICFLHLSQTCETHRTYRERLNAQTHLKKPPFPNFISISFVCYLKFPYWMFRSGGGYLEVETMVLYQSTCLINIRPEVLSLYGKQKYLTGKCNHQYFFGGRDGNKHKPFCIYLHNQHQTHQLVNRYVSFILVHYKANSKYFYLAVKKSSHQKRVTNTSWLLQLPFVTFQKKL